MAGDIRSLRKKKKLRLRDLATAARVEIGELSKWERGLELPSDEQFSMIAKALGSTSEELSRAHRRIVQKAVPGEGYTTHTAKGMKVYPRTSQPKRGQLRVLDLFCGAGGFSFGFEQTGKFSVTAGIDLLPDRIDTFRSNHPAATGIVADIRDFSIERLADESMEPDVIIGGPPCQGFSSIRPFRTLTDGDPRNNLFEYFILAVDHMKPQWFVLENVVGLLSHEEGKVFDQILQSFGDAGYSTSFRVLNAAHFGLPQNRERLVIVGNRRGMEFPWPDPTHFSNHRSMAGKHRPRCPEPSLFEPEVLPAVTVMEAIHDLPDVEAGKIANWYRKDVQLTDYERAIREGCEELTLHEATDHSEKMMAIIRMSGSNRSALPPGLTSSGFSTCYSRLEADRPSVTITVNFVHPASNKCIHPFQHRALTIREGARLQGFPDRFQFRGTKAQIVKQIGNAVPPLLGRVIATSLAEVGRGHAGSPEAPCDSCLLTTSGKGRGR